MKSRAYLLLVLLLAAASSALADSRPEVLTLDAVLGRVEANHPKLRGAQLANRIASAKVLEKQGAFDPGVSLATTYETYNTSSSPGKEYAYFSNRGTVFQTTPSGIKWEAGIVNNQGRVKSPNSSTGDVGEFFVEASIPLLRGLNINEKSVALQQAQIMEEQVRFDYRQLRLAVLLNAGSSYYDWVTAVVQREIVEENLQLAVERAEQVRTSIEAGDKPRIDQVEADREVENRREALIKAERIVQKAALKLALYLWNSSGQADAVPTTEMAPRSLPSGRKVSESEVAELQVEAWQSRPELRRLDLQKDIISLDKDLAANQRLPQLDLKLGPGYDAGNQGIGFNFKAGIQMIIPLATRAADGREMAASIKLDKLSLDQIEMVRRILLEVQDAASEVQTTALRLERALEIYRLARELEEAERLKFRLGDSSLFLVNTRERSTVAAALKVLEIRNEQAQSLLLLETVSGKL